MPPQMPPPVVTSGSMGMNKMKMIGGAIVALVVVIGGAIFGIYSYSHPTFYVVNATGKDGLTVTIDGEPMVTGLKGSLTESKSATESKMLASGKHKIEAKDAAGKVIETVDVEIKSGSDGYLFAPGRAKTVCFFVQVDTYGSGGGTGSDIPLDATKTFWEMPASIDHWFEDTPMSVDSKSSSVRRALRQVPCSDL